MELKFLKKYLNKMFIKSHIHKSKLLVSSPIIFIPKPNGKKRWILQPCIDFWKFNVITMKNKYFIFNIQKLQDQLKNVKWFIKLDQWTNFNLIRMKEKKIENYFPNILWIFWILNNAI